MFIFKSNESLVVDFDDRTFSFTGDKAEEVSDKIRELYPDEDAIYNFVININRNPDEIVVNINDVKASNILVLKGMSVYLKGGAEISMPRDLVVKILDAEKNNNQQELSKYLNFWNLVCLNPDARVRNNIFWYLRKWDVDIAPSGLIIAYRNATLKEGSNFSTDEVKNILRSYYNKVILHGEDNKELINLYNQVMASDSCPVYTDMHSHSTTIKLGQPVRIPREDCDPVQEHTCSRGLHVASAGWLSANYYGNVGLQVLVNPANIVAVPPEDGYGKMRCCEYFPIALIDFDEDGNVIVPDYDITNDFNYIKEIMYDGKMSDEDIDKYTIANPEYLSNSKIYSSILEKLEGEQ